MLPKNISHNSLLNVYNRQIILIKKAIVTLHEDLQYDYQLEFDHLLDE